MHRAALVAFAWLIPIAISQSNDLDILAGIHTIYSYPDTAQPPIELIELTKAGLVGGVILFGENIDADVTPAAMLALQDAYQESPAPALIHSLTGIEYAPLLIMTDQEGGVVKRIPEGGPETSAKQVGLSSDPEDEGRKAGSSAAETLRKYNNNANLAPVLCVYREEGDFLDQYERSYHNTTEVVIQAGIAFLEGSQANGVAAAAKHFPGLGAAAAEENTDLRPVTLDVPVEDLRAIDIPPFAAAIEAGVDMIMPSWAIYPAIDAERPAGLSRTWLQGELRERLGYKGVTITDAIEAGAVVPFGDHGAVAGLATAAGMDLLLASGRNVTSGEVVRKALAQGVSSGELDSHEFDLATERIVALRQKLGAAE
jgi:beta-glucosidase-like glycosyl hydrolase